MRVISLEAFYEKEEHAALRFLLWNAWKLERCWDR